MKNGKMILFAGLALLVIGFYISVSMTFLFLLLGTLIIPPIVAMALTLNEGVSILLKEYAKSNKIYYYIVPLHQNL
jgi:hypothetical protein